jgi:hypothetical protein
MTSVKIRLRRKGGPGSGNWGHSGRPGMVGGSAPGTGGRIFKKEAYLAKKRAWLISNSPRKQLEAAIASVNPDLDDKAIQTISDVMLLDRKRFDYYKDKFNVPVDSAFASKMFAADYDIDRSIAQLRWDIEDEATYKDPVTGEKFCNMLGSDAFNKKFGNVNVPNVTQKLAREYGVDVRREAKDVEQSQKDLSSLYAIAKSHPVVGKMLAGKKVIYEDSNPTRPSASASFDISRNAIIIYRSSPYKPTGDYSATWIHELVHSIEPSGKGFTALFGKGRTASLYGNMNYSEDFAEIGTAYILGYQMNWIGKKWKYVGDIIDAL